MIPFPVKRPLCPVCGKRCRVVERICCTTANDHNDYDTEAVTIRCKNDGDFEVMKVMRT